MELTPNQKIVGLLLASVGIYALYEYWWLPRQKAAYKPLPPTPERRPMPEGGLVPKTNGYPKHKYKLLKDITVWNYAAPRGNPNDIITGMSSMGSPTRTTLKYIIPKGTVIAAMPSKTRLEDRNAMLQNAIDKGIKLSPYITNQVLGQNQGKVFSIQYQTVYDPMPQTIWSDSGSENKPDYNFVEVAANTPETLNKMVVSKDVPYPDKMKQMALLQATGQIPPIVIADDTPWVSDPHFFDKFKGLDSFR